MKIKEDDGLLLIPTVQITNESMVKDIVLNVEKEKQFGKILSICIPTYNRERKLKQFLQCAVEECEKLGITICVSDNASTDDTEIMVREFMKHHPNIKYHKNNINVGALRNFNSALAMANTNYKWLMGDDDLINKESLCKILDILYKYNPQLLIVNGGRRLKNGEFRCNVSNIKSRIYKNKNELLGDVGYYMSWMSCLIICEDYIEDYTKYNWTAFWHTASLLTQFGLMNKIYVYFESSPVVYNNNYESGGEDYSKSVLEYFTNDWYKISVNIPNYNDVNREKFRYGHRDNVYSFGLKDFMVLRICGAFNYNVYKKIKRNIKYASKETSWKILMIALLPPVMPRVIYYKVKKIKQLIKEWIE